MFGLENPQISIDDLIKELMSRPPSNEEELDLIKKECEVFGSVIHGGKPVEVFWVSGKGWFWSFTEGKHGTITADEKDAKEKGLGYCKGVMIHEESHVLLSRPEVFDDKTWGKRGFGMGYNWVEDCRIEYNPDLVVNDGKNLVKHHLEVDAAAGGGLDYKGRSKEGSMSAPQQQIGYIPRHMMFGAMMRQYFFHREYVGDFDSQQQIDDFIEEAKQINPEVAEAFEKVRPHLDDFYKTIPGNLYPTEEEVMAKAKESGKIYEDLIWPEYEKLIDQAYDEHTLQKFIEELLDGAEFGDSSGGEGMVIIIDFDSLPEDVQQEIKEKMQGAPGGGEGEGGESSESEGGEESGEGETGEGEGSEAGEQSGSQGGSFQDLGEKSKEAVKEAFEKVSEEDKQQISDQADQEMAEVDKEVNKTLQGNSDQEKSVREVPGESAESAEDAEEAGEEGEPSDSEGEAGDEGEGEESETNVPEPAKQQTRRELTPEEREAIKKYEDQMAEKTKAGEGKTNFDVYRKPLEAIISTLKYSLAPHFDPNDEPEITYEREDGVYDYDRRRRQRTGEDPRDGRVYAVETEAVKRNYRFTILIDLSGSMDMHIEEVFKTIVILSEVLTYLGIDFEIQGYSQPRGGYEHNIYKEHGSDTYFGARVSERTKNEVGAILNDVDGGTPTSRALVNTHQNLSERKQSDESSFQDFLLVLTDGSPTDSIKPEITDSKLSAKLVVDSIRGVAEQNGHELAVLGFGIGSGTDFVQDIFGQLPLGLRSIIASELNRFRKKNAKGTTRAAKEINPDQVSNAYDSAAELSHVLPQILEYILENWDEFG